MKLTTRVLYGLVTMTLVSIFFYYQVKTVSRKTKTNVEVTKAIETLQKVAAEVVVTTDAPKKKIHSIGEEAYEVTASARGNLGPPRVVINKKSIDWLKDRWQAAKNMQGEPIPGKHFIEITFKEPIGFIQDITLDYETAFSSKFVITAFSRNTFSRSGNILTLYSYKQKNNICQTIPVDKSRKQHVVYILNCDEERFLQKEKSIEGNINVFKIEMEHSTNWGVSLWNIGINGRYK